MSHSYIRYSTNLINEGEYFMCNRCGWNCGMNWNCNCNCTCRRNCDCRCNCGNTGTAGANTCHTAINGKCAFRTGFNNGYDKGFTAGWEAASNVREECERRPAAVQGAQSANCGCAQQTAQTVNCTCNCTCARPVNTTCGCGCTRGAAVTAGCASQTNTVGEHCFVTALESEEERQCE